MYYRTAETAIVGRGQGTSVLHKLNTFFGLTVSSTLASPPTDLVELITERPKLGSAAGSHDLRESGIRQLQTALTILCKEETAFQEETNDLRETLCTLSLTSLT